MLKVGCAITDIIDRPYALMLTAGNVRACTSRAGSRMRYLLADKGYDVDRLRRSLRDAGAGPVIPEGQNRKRTIRYDKVDNAAALIENAFCCLKAQRLLWRDEY